MKNTLIALGTLALFALMVTDPYIVTWGLIIFAVVAGVADTARRYKRP